MSWSRLGVVVGSAVLIAVGGTVLPASGEDPLATGPIAEPGGLLVVETGVTDRVYLDADGNGLADRQQSLSAQSRCLLGSDESLLSFDGYVGSGTSDLASFAGDSLGVAEKKSGTSCATVDAPSERLVLSLNEANLSGPIGPRLAASAYLDMDLKQDARIRATASLDGTQVGVFELRSGSTVGAPVPAGVVVHDCVASADSGPDSTTGDNCRWPISSPSWLGPDDGVYFDSLELQAVTGSFGLKNGADGVVQPVPPSGFPVRASFFELITDVDGRLLCRASTETVNADGTAPEVTVRRLDNADPAEACELIPYTLRNSSSSARFLKPLDEQTSAQFVFDVVWNLPATNGLPLPSTTVDFEQGTGRTAIGWCPDPVYAGDLLVGIGAPLDVPDLDPLLDGTQYACLGTQDARVLDGAQDYVTVAEQVFVIGDIRLQK